MDLGNEMRDLVHDIEDDAREILKGAKENARSLAEGVQKKTGRSSNRLRPRLRRAAAATVRRTIRELEKIEDRLD
jgi:vacuolar-type H+-ATPase subunit E/Vma4